MMIGISLIESTAYIKALSPLLLIFPTPKLLLIDFNNNKSFICKVIEKVGLTLHVVFNLAFCCIFIEKHPSASVKPVKNHGFISDCMIVENDLFLNWLEGILKG